MHSIESLTAERHQAQKKRWYWMLASCTLPLLLFILDIATGPSLLPVTEVSKVLLNTLGLDMAVDSTAYTIVMELRLPIALMALVVGGALGVGGAEMQTLLGNPMASPYTLGMAAAAGLGAALMLFFDGFGLNTYIAVPVGAFVFCMLAALILFGLAVMRHIGPTHLILAGIALLFLFQSLLSLVQFIASPELSQQILFWLFGSVSKATWVSVSIVSTVTAICLALFIKDAWKLTALRLGEERARSLGIKVDHLRAKTLLLVAVMTATATSFVGVIGFIGLVAPNISRMIVGEDQRFFIPVSFMVGAVLLSSASVLSKVLVPGALFPIGIVTAIVGVPFFFWLILFRRQF